MDKRLLSHDPLTGLKTWHSFDSLTDETTISYSADSTPILEENKLKQNDAYFSRAGIKSEFWQLASIPVMVQMDWLINKGVDIYNKDHFPKVCRLLDDPEYKYLKTTTGRHLAK